MPRAVGPYWRFDHERLQRRVWSPALLRPNAWWDFSDLSTISAVSTGVNNVTDKSGNGFTATQATTTVQPQLATNGITLNGTSQFLNISGPTITGPCTFIDVFRRASSGINSVMLCHTTNNQPHAVRWSGVNTFTSALGDSVSITHGSSSTATGDFVTATIRDGTNTAAWLNGTLLGSNANLTLTSQSFNAIGRRSAFYHTGIIRECLMWQRALTTKEMEQVVGSLAHKYNFASRLPATHPYRDRPPTLER
jgi:hypothetical protein